MRLTADRQSSIPPVSLDAGTGFYCKTSKTRPGCSRHSTSRPSKVERKSRILQSSRAELALLKEQNIGYDDPAQLDRMLDEAIRKFKEAGLIRMSSTPQDLSKQAI